MTGSLAKAALSFIFALVLMAKAPAFSQSDVGAPVQLPGAGTGEDEEAPANTVPQSVPIRPGSSDLGIQVGVIASRAPTIGMLSGSDGLGGEIWIGTTATQAQILLNQIPIGAPSRAMGDLVRLLLLTASRPPEDQRGGDTILDLRLERSLDAGLIDAVPVMIDQATHLVNDPEVSNLRAETILLTRGGVGACTNETANRFESEEPFWMKLRAYCFVHQGLIPAARLTADLLYEIGDEDELFQDLLERLAGNSDVEIGGPFDTPSALHLAMMRDANIVPELARGETTSLSIARSMAREPNWSSEEGIAYRIEMAERAARSGVMTSPELLNVYQEAAPYDTSQRTQQLSAAANNVSPVSRAIFAEAAVVDGITGARAEVMTAALSAADPNIANAYAAALGRGTRDMKAEDVLAWASYNFAVTALADGNMFAAYDWFDTYSRSAEPAPARVQALQVAIMMAAASERFAFWPEHAFRWLEQADLGDLSHTRLTSQLMWFEAMGYEIPPAVRERLALHENDLAGVAPPPAVIGNLRRATEAGRMGETVAYALVAVGPGGPNAAHPAAVAEAIRALRLAGRVNEARALASEALLGFALEDVE